MGGTECTRVLLLHDRLGAWLHLHHCIRALEENGVFLVELKKRRLALLRCILNLVVGDERFVWLDGPALTDRARV